MTSLRLSIKTIDGHLRVLSNRKMNAQTQPLKIVAYTIEKTTDTHCLVIAVSGEGSLCIESHLIPWLELIDGQRNLAEVLAEAHRRRWPLRLSELSNLIEGLVSSGLLTAGYPKGLGTPPLAANTSTPHPSIQAQPLPKLKLPDGLWWFFALAVFASAILGLVPAFTLPTLPLFDLNNLPREPFAWAFTLALCFLLWIGANIRTFLRLLFCTLALGRLPRLRQWGWRRAFLLMVPREELNLLQRHQQAMIHGLAGVSPGLMALLLSHLLPAPWQWLVEVCSLLQTLLLLSPFHDSDLTKFITALLPPKDSRHFLPFLRHRALVASWSKKTQLPNETRLILFACAGIGWLQIMTSISFDFASTYLPLWLEFFWSFDDLEIKHSIFMTSSLAIETLVLWLLLTIYLIQEIATLIYRNAQSLLRPWRSLQNLLTRNQADLPSLTAVVQQLASIPFFSVFSPTELESLVEQSTLINVYKGHYLIREGDPGHELFVLLRGEVRVCRHLETGVIETLTHLYDNAIFGEVAILEPVKRSADVEAMGEVLSLRIPSTVFNEMINNQSLLSDKKTQLKNRITLSRAITHSPFFKSFQQELLDLLVQSDSAFIIPETGAKIISQGQSGQEFYIVAQGNVQVQRDQRTIATLEMGQFFGEMAILENQPRNADVVAGKNCILLKISASSFFEMLATHWGLALTIDLVSLLRTEQAA